MVGMMSRISLMVARVPARASITRRAGFEQTTKRFFLGSNSAATDGPFSRPLSEGWSTLATTSCNDDDDTEYHGNHVGGAQSRNVQNPFFQQVRWKRNDGNKASMKERPATKKQMKAYNRKNRARQAEQEQHAKPGSKAGPRREWEAQQKQDLLDSRKDDQLPVNPDEYDMDDALLDDLIGNTKYNSSQPTPKPVYLGNKEKHYFHRVADQMERYQLKMGDSTASSSTSGDKQSNHALTDVSNAELPSDRDISLALRAHRDRNGTRQKPIGIVAALKLLLQDLGVPLRTFGENTFTTLLTCCRTPAEGRRILQMMHQQQHPVTAYSWSILIDIHAKIGDYEGCVNVIDEMVAAGVAPGLPAYTSLMAACYKVCTDGRISHAVRKKAGEVGWRKWQEMRIVGLDPDVMAYGAILRLCAAQGQPEKSLNILEEMVQMQVKPTTLCFSSALRAVAKSHATAIRYEQGSSKKDRRREFLTGHHGKMARTLVIMAENAEVHQDRGFVAALTACAAAAGDIATAKAIYVASQVRRLDQLRTVGPNSHLARLRGQSAPMDSIGDEVRQSSSSMLADGGARTESGDLLSSGDGDALSSMTEMNGKNQRKRYPSFEQREYGKDTRPLSAILHACASAVDKNGIGTMWQGRENGGYLHEDSLRLLTARRLPKYHDNSIPEMSARQVAMSAVSWGGEDKAGDFRGDKRKSRNFEGLDDDDDVGTTLDTIDEQFSRMYEDKDGRRKEEYRKTTPEDMWRLKYPNDTTLKEVEAEDGVMELPEGKAKATKAVITQGKERTLLSVPDQPEEEMYFDHDTMKWQTRSRQREQVTPEIVDSHPSSDSALSEASEESDENEEIYFDKSTMTWTMKKAIAETKPLHGNETQESMGSRDRGMSSSETVVEDNEDEFYFDSSEMRWKTRSRIEAEKAKRTDYEAKMLLADENEREDGVDENGEEVSLDRHVRGISHVLLVIRERCGRELWPVLSSLGGSSTLSSETM
jgi:pentatricopeptide repeat protein